MPRETLDRKIQALWDSILLLDSMVETAVKESVDALKKQNIELARKVYAGDTRVNAARFEIENAVITTIATQQPIMASDLRLLASMLEVAGELERMGDYAKGNARIAILIGNRHHIKPLIDIQRMAELSVNMLHRAVGAFLNRDADTARLIPGEDDLVDALYNRVFIDLVNVMLEDPSQETIQQANYLMWAAHNLERLSDRVTNICERVVYVSTGEVKELDTIDRIELAKDLPNYG
jgi:phosphate transport system protein